MLQSWAEAGRGWPWRRRLPAGRPSLFLYWSVARRARQAIMQRRWMNSITRFALRFMQNIAEETITHRHSTRDTAVPIRQYGSFLPGSGVGGSGEHWNGNSFRYLPEIFRLASHLKEKYGSAHVPEGLGVQDWGISYEDLEAYYWRAEKMMGVSGKAGNLRGQLIEGGNIFEGQREHEYPTPPLKDVLLHDFISGWDEEAGLPSLSGTGGNAQRTVSQPGRNDASRMRLLRILRTLRLHGGSQGAAD